MSLGWTPRVASAPNEVSIRVHKEFGHTLRAQIELPLSKVPSSDMIFWAEVNGGNGLWGSIEPHRKTLQLVLALRARCGLVPGLPGDAVPGEPAGDDQHHSSRPGCVLGDLFCPRL